MKILLLGKGGQVGWELQRSLAPLGQIVALDRLSGADFLQPEALRQTVHDQRPDLIVNAAAYTAVDRAESEPDAARTVNAVTPGVLAEVAEALGAWLVHYSTDYVFDGSGDRPWRETDPTGPVNVYGQTKLEGESRIAAATRRHLILRTSWVHAARGGNFARTMLRLARERETLSVIDDQVGAPTSAELLADVSAHLIRTVTAPEGERLAGLYHLVAAGETSWFRYACHVIETARRLRPDLPLAVRDIRPVASSAFQTAARRPMNSRLDTTRLRQAFGLHLPSWESGIDRLLSEILEERTT
jgi:dTDP-4-dehydrorhamnose reductase